MRRVSPLVDRLRNMHGAAAETQVTLLAAATAFYAFLSIVPLAVLGVAVAVSIGGRTLIRQLVATFDHLITTEAIEIIETSLEAGSGQTTATVAGIVFGAWGALKVFRALDRAFNAIYGDRGRASIAHTIGNALVVLIAILGILIAMGIAFVGLWTLGLTLPGIVLPIAMTPFVAVVLLPMYLVFPPRWPGVRHAIPGAALCALGITAATAGLQAYLTLASPFAVYGVLAGLFVVMLWLYVIAIAVLMGAVANATRFGEHRQLHGSAGP